jgi:hypothetical protein
MDYYQKYQKYKFKYLNLLNQYGGSSYCDKDINEIKNKKLKEINEIYMNKNNKLTPKQYYDICVLAVTSNLSEFEYVLHTEMKVEQYLEICKKILEIAYYFEVPYERYLKICIKAVKNNGLAFEYIHEDYFKNNYNDYYKLFLIYNSAIDQKCNL